MAFVFTVRRFLEYLCVLAASGGCFFLSAFVFIILVRFRWQCRLCYGYAPEGTTS